MAEIRPFPALRYAPDVALDSVTCPPYDVLSVEQRNLLFARSPYATAHLILPEGEGDAKYASAAALLKEMREERILRLDPGPALYVTRTQFTEPGTGVRKERLGLVCLLRLHEYADRVVLPHERTLTGPKEDRLKLIRATGGNLESIMLVVDDPDTSLQRALTEATHRDPVASFEGDDDQRHTLYRVDRDEAIRQVQANLAGKEVFIADGHHRYETSLAIAKERGALGTEAPEAFLLVTITSLADPGLVVLPTHRLVRGTPPESRDRLLETLAERFTVTKVGDEAIGEPLTATADAPGTFTFLLALPDGLYRLTVEGGALAQSLPSDLPPSLAQLDVTRLLHLVLDPVFGIGPDAVATTDRLSYTRSAEEAVARVRSGEYDAACLLSRPTVEGMLDVSRADEVMPQKSTFFYPKLLSGLVMRVF